MFTTRPSVLPLRVRANSDPMEAAFEAALHSFVNGNNDIGPLQTLMTNAAFITYQQRQTEYGKLPIVRAVKFCLPTVASLLLAATNAALPEKILLDAISTYSRKNDFYALVELLDAHHACDNATINAEALYTLLKPAGMVESPSDAKLRILDWFCARFKNKIAWSYRIKQVPLVHMILETPYYVVLPILCKHHPEAINDVNAEGMTVLNRVLTTQHDKHGDANVGLLKTVLACNPDLDQPCITGQSGTQQKPILFAYLSGKISHAVLIHAHIDKQLSQKDRQIFANELDTEMQQSQQNSTGSQTLKQDYHSEAMLALTTRVSMYQRQCERLSRAQSAVHFHDLLDALQDIKTLVRSYIITLCKYHRYFAVLLDIALHKPVYMYDSLVRLEMNTFQFQNEDEWHALMQDLVSIHELAFVYGAQQVREMAVLCMQERKFTHRKALLCEQVKSTAAMAAAVGSEGSSPVFTPRRSSQDNIGSPPLSSTSLSAENHSNGTSTTSLSDISLSPPITSPSRLSQEGEGDKERSISPKRSG